MDEFLVIVEAKADFTISTKLAERVLLETIEWLEPEYLSGAFKWRGIRENTEYLSWTNLKNEIACCERELGYRPRSIGHSSGKPLKSYGTRTKKALNLIRFLQRKADYSGIRAVLLILDTDSDHARKEGLAQACGDFEGVRSELEIVVGVANPKREAWVLNGYEPLGSDEKRLLSEQIKELGFDPRKEPERLRSSSTGTESARSRNSKDVLDTLTGGNWERQRQCWEDTELSTLRLHGSGSGLTDYLGEVEARLVPIVGGKS